jgi:hypothetical protein
MAVKRREGVKAALTLNSGTQANKICDFKVIGLILFVYLRL